jgi:hypothetical protein
MSAKGVLSVVGTAIGGLIGWTDVSPAAEPSVVRRLLEDLGLPPGFDLAAGVGGGPPPPPPARIRRCRMRAKPSTDG